MTKLLLPSLLLLLVAAWNGDSGRAASATFEDRDVSPDDTVRAFRVEEGLPDSAVTAIAQTSDGYVWLGTRNGLVRLDGLRVQGFSNGNSPALGSSWITALAPGPDGRLWIGLADGSLARFKDGGIEPIFGTPPAEMGRIHCLVATPGDGVLLGTDQGLLSWSANQGLTIPSAGRDTGAVWDLAAGPGGVVWAGCARGLWKYQNGALTVAEPRGAAIHSVALASDDVIWLAGNEVGLLEKKGSDGTPRRVWSVSQVRAFQLRRSGELWLVTEKGRLERILSDGRSAGVLETGAEQIHAIFEDREGNLWIGTEGQGALLIRAKSIKHIRLRDGAFIGTQSCTESADGTLWCTGRNGQVYTVADGVAGVYSLPDRPDLFVEAMMASRQGGYWIATRFDGLFFWPGVGQTMQPRGPGINGSALFEDRQGRVWTASARDGVRFWDRNGWRQISDSAGANFREASCFANQKDGGVWIGLRRGGLALWKEGVTRRIPLAADIRVNCLFADPEGNLWVGSSDGLMLGRGQELAWVDPALGFPRGDLQQIQEDLRGHLWVAATSGIFRARRTQVLECMEKRASAIQITSFGREDGLPSARASGGIQPASWKTGDGRICFTSLEGLIVVDPLKTAALDLPVPAVIEEIQVDRRRVSPAGGEEILRIPAGYQHMSIRYSGPTFLAPERTPFRFRLEGLESEWVPGNEYRVATYGRIPAGDYRFEVMAQSREGIWPASGTGLWLRVAPGYWETAWFKALWIGGMAALGLMFWGQHRARRRALNALRQQLTRDLHDDLGSNLGSIALLSEALGKSSNRPNHQALLQEIHRIARQTLDSMRDTLWFVDPEKDSGADLAEHLRQIAASTLVAIPHEYHSSGNTTRQTISLKAKRDVILIYKEALHNVIRHSQAKHVKIHVQFEEKTFLFEIMDDGVGFDTRTSHPGHGLNSMKHRAAHLGGTVAIRSTPGQGTRVEFQAKLIDGPNGRVR